MNHFLNFSKSSLKTFIKGIHYVATINCLKQCMPIYVKELKENADSTQYLPSTGHNKIQLDYFYSLLSNYIALCRLWRNL